MHSPDQNPLAWIDDDLADLEGAGLRRRLVERHSPQSAHVVIDGKTLINFGSNDYLGLANDLRLAAAAKAAIDRDGWGSGASPLVSGRSHLHAQLERRLAEFEGAEAALLFPSGFAANAGVIPALVDEPDAIYADAKNHASLIDGCRLARAQRFIYPHCDVDALAALLDQGRHFRRRLIVTDSLFSMDGDLAPLDTLFELAETHHCMLLLDEAHTTGVFPEKGSERFLIRVGTLSKALGSAGGFVCGSQPLIDWLANRARTYVFSTAQPAATSAAALAALDIVEQEPDRGRQLLATAARFRARLREQGWNTGRSQSQIIPLYLGDPARTMTLAARLREAGYFLPGIRPPTVPEGESLLRISLCAHHTDEMHDRLVDGLGHPPAPGHKNQ